MARTEQTTREVCNTPLVPFLAERLSRGGFGLFGGTRPQSPVAAGAESESKPEIPVYIGVRTRLHRGLQPSGAGVSSGVVRFVHRGELYPTRNGGVQELVIVEVYADVGWFAAARVVKHQISGFQILPGHGDAHVEHGAHRSGQLSPIKSLVSILNEAGTIESFSGGSPVHVARAQQILIHLCPLLYQGPVLNTAIR